RLMGRVRTDLEFLPPDRLLEDLPERLHQVQQGVSDVSQAVARRYFANSAVVGWTLEEADR
ncbi:MAG TPA: alpha-E domain-containing protein, partial [Mycobacteriales bacterium]|nr:alpha-E domain-containing protein [Mycobacteriales bacterium]